MRVLIATLTALMLFATTPVAARVYQDASAAYRAGDYQKAFRLFVPLAEQGVVWAQFIVGGMYDKGKVVPEDGARAYAWFSIVAAHGDARGKKAKGFLAKLMTPTQIAGTQKLSRGFWKKYVVPFQKE